MHASTNIFQSFDINTVPRAEAAGLLGSLLCFPKASLPKPVFKPSEPQLVVMDCPELQDHILNIMLRCARREPTSKARCIAIASLGQWIIKNLTNPTYVQKNFSQNIPTKNIKTTSSASSPRSASTPPPTNSSTTTLHPRIKETIEVLLQALQFKHRTIARVAAETLKLCAERGKQIAKIERLPHLIINAICVALEIQNVQNPKDSDKVILMALLLCLGEFCMAIPINILMTSGIISNNNNSNSSNTNESGDSLIMIVLKILHQIATGSHTDRIKLFTANEDFDMSIAVDDVKVHKSSEANYQTTETTQNCIAAIRLCAKTVAMHLVTNLGHFPMGIGASRLSSMVDEQDDLTWNFPQQQQHYPHHNHQQQQQLYQHQSQQHTEFSGTVRSSSGGGDSIEFSGTNAPNVVHSNNLQMFLLNSGLLASFIELPALKLPGGGITAGLITADRQVRVLLRDLNGKACWDASILYREPKLQLANIDVKQNNNIHFQNGYYDQRTSTFPISSSSSLSPSLYTQSIPPIKPARNFLIGSSGGGTGSTSLNTTSLDPLISTIGMPMYTPQHTLRHRRPNQLPLAKDLAHDLDQLDDVSVQISHLFILVLL